MLKEKYPDMPEPGTTAWVDFLKRLKEEAPEDYKNAILLGGGVTQALQREIQRSKRRDFAKELLGRFFTRQHPTGNVPDKRKWGLWLFLIVGGLFAFAFFFGTAPKKEAKGGGVGAVVAGGLASGDGVPTVEASPKGTGTEEATKANGNATGADGNAAKVGSSPLEGGSQGASGATTAEASSPGTASGNTGNALSPTPSPPGNVSNLPAPPPPVYGSYGTTPTPPDPALASSGGTGYPAPPPMVVYASPGMGVSSQGQAQGQPATSPPPSGGSVEPQAQGYTLPSGMMVYTAPSPGMMVVASPPSQGGMVVASEGGNQGELSPTSTVPMPSPYPTYPQGPSTPGR